MLALSRAATSAKPVKIRASGVIPPTKDSTPAAANASPTAWANCGGAASSSSEGGASRGLTYFLKSIWYGERPRAPRANTTV